MLKSLTLVLLALAVTGCASTQYAKSSEVPTEKVKNIEIAKKIYADFMKGDIDSVLAAMSDDVTWEVAGPSTVPYAGVRHGKKEWMDYLQGLGTVDVVAFEPKEFLADQDKVVVLGTEQLKVKSNGKMIDEKWAQVITFSGGKVIHFRSYDDSAASAAAFRSTP